MSRDDPWCWIIDISVFTSLSSSFSGPRLLGTREEEVDDVGAELRRWIEEDITPEWIRNQQKMRKMSNSRRVEEVGIILAWSNI